MNLHYMVEKAFDDLEDAIAYAELHDSTSAADAERYAQLLDDVVGLRDGVKKESAPAVGATEAEKENTPIPSIQGDGEKVKNRLVIEELESVTSYSSEINAMGAEGLARLYAATQTAFVNAAKESGIPFDFLEFVAKKIGPASKVGRADR